MPGIGLRSRLGGIRTPNPRFRRPMLYPIELRTRTLVTFVTCVPRILTINSRLASPDDLFGPESIDEAKPINTSS